MAPHSRLHSVITVTETERRFAIALRRLRWPAVIVWLLAIVLLHGLSGSLSKVTNDTASAYLPSSAPSTKVALLQQAQGQGTQRGAGQAETNAAIVVFVRDSGLTARDRAAAAAARTAVAGLSSHVAGLGLPGLAQPSADGKAIQFTVNITAPASQGSGPDRTAVQAVRGAVAGPAGQAGDGLVVAVTGQAAINADSAAGNQQTILLLTALVIVAVILLLVYRSPLLWLLPLFGAIAAIIVAQASAHGLASAGLTVSTLSADILIVLVFGAASDYALLLVHRYREELRHHAATEDAMAVTLRATLPNLVASAATVSCAMICLLTADSASLHGLGPVGAVGIVSALLAQATFLPALLLIFGRAAFWPRIPRYRAAGREESRAWAGDTRGVLYLVLMGVAALGMILGYRYLTARKRAQAELTGSEQYQRLAEEYRRLADIAITAQEHTDLKLGDLSAQLGHLREQNESPQKILKEPE
jgi:putative drug exporter of the RND superfamily